MVFFLGIAVIVFAIVAVFKRLFVGSSEFEFGGFKVSGKGAPTIFLFVGVILSFSGRGWYHSLNQVGELKQTVGRVEVAKKEFADATTSFSASLDQQVKQNELLRAQISPARLQQLERQERQVFAVKKVQLSPMVIDEMKRRGMQ